MAIKTIFGNQVDALVRDINLLEYRQGSDTALFEKIRRLVSGELLNLGRLNVCSAAIGELEDEKAVDRFKAIIIHCSQHFYLEDRVLSAIAIPLSVRVKCPPGFAFTLKDAKEGSLAILAKIAGNLSGARQIYFDNRLFDGKSLFYCNAQKLSKHLRQLERGVKQPSEGLANCRVSSNANAWEMVYLLAGAVTDLHAPLPIDQLQQVLGDWTHQASRSLEQHDQVVFSRGVTVQAHCHGFHYRHRGIEVGENAIRGCRLQTLFANFDMGEEDVKLYYVHDLNDSQVKLLVVSSAMTVQHCCKLMGDETLEGFRGELAIAIRTVFVGDQVTGAKEVSMYDYTNLAHAHGLSVWGVLP